MKNIILLLLNIYSIQIVIGQEIRYRNYLGNGQYETTDTEFPPEGVASDFGPRRYGDRWHGGVDFNDILGNDEWDLILSPESGEIVDINRIISNNGDIRYISLDAGNHRYLFLHMFDNNNSVPRWMNGNSIYLNHLYNDNQRWGIVILLNGDTIVIGQRPGQILFGGDTLIVTNQIAQYAPLGPLGSSGDSDSNLSGIQPYAPHLHLSTIPDNLMGSGGDAFNRNPLEYLQYNDTTYTVSIITFNNSNGISVTYPGTLSTKIRVRPSMNGQTNASHLSKINAIDKIKVLISPANQNNYTLIQGLSSENIISIGGRLGDTVINHTKGIDGSWTQQGIDPYMLTGGSPKLYDDYYFLNFIPRIHKNDIIGDNISQMAYCPQDARYNDGRYEIKARILDVKRDSFDGGAESFIIDNFKPYISRVVMSIGNQTIYDGQWDCQICGGVVYNNTIIEYVNQSDFQQFNLLVHAYSSEPLSNLNLDIPFFQQSNLTPTTISPDSTEWVFTIPGNSNVIQGADQSLLFEGNDVAGNGIINLEMFTQDTCTQIPIRTGANIWSNPDNIITTVDATHEIPLFCPVITPVAVVTTPSSCIINDGFIHLLQINGEGSQGTDIEWWDMQTSTELVPAYGSISNLAPGIYRLSITDLESGCISQTFYDLNTPSTQINTDVYSSPTCVGASVGAIEVDAYTLDYSGGSYDFAWSNGEITTDAIISEINGLAAGIYTVTVSSPETGCTTMTSVEVVAIAPSAPLSVTGTSLNACPGLANGIVTLQVTGGISPYAYHWSSTSYGSHPNNLAPGTHTVTVTDYCGTSVTMTFNITQMEYVIFDIPGCADEGALSI